jgi:3-oxoacyl-[acyl-carrier-protein] synthase-1/3-oxoacyl-[acyl-carrier-protein] synthase II
MKPVAVLAVGAESALGTGRDAFGIGELGDTPVTAIAADDELRRVGLKKPFMARACRSVPPRTDPAAWLLERAASGLVAHLDASWPKWRTRRLGIVVGTSSGGMAPLTEALRLRASGEEPPPDLMRRAPYFGPLVALDSAFPGPSERVQVLAACASSAVAMGIGCRWLELGLVDLVVAGGYDAVTPFVASGFESLGATSADRPRPFRVGRDGMALGEAAVLFAMALADDASGATGRPLGYVCGFGASSDAAHVTAPDRDGQGLLQAAQAALSDSGLSPGDVGLVSAHATATPFNDAAEARALEAIFGDRLQDVVVHPFKAIVGHTLGASAGLELVACLDAMNRGILPAAAGHGTVEPESLRLLGRNDVGQVTACLKLSAAFGGANAALVGSTEAGRGSPLRPSGVQVLALGEPITSVDLEQLGRVTQIPSVHLARFDPLSALAVAAAASALAKVPASAKARTGVVVGTAAATIENNEAFDRKLRERGPRGVEPRRFPCTSPNLAAGQVSIAFGLRGPSLSVGAGLSAAIEGLVVAHDLLAAGDADAIVVVAVEDVGDSVRGLWAGAGWPVPAHGALAVLLGRTTSAGLIRARLRNCQTAAEAAGGAVEGTQPGWPSFRHVLALSS